MNADAGVGAVLGDECKLRLRLGGDPTGDEYPDKPPPRMRWATYNRLMDRRVAADGVADERLLAARLLWDQIVQ